MKKYLLNIMIFFAIVTAIDFAIGYAGDYLVRHIKSGDIKRTNDLAMIDKHDVLILGSSRARHHYDTPFLSDTLGLDVYNAGYDGNGVILAYGLLEMIIERYQPKLIIYDVEPTFDINLYAGDNSNKRYISRLKPYYRYKAIGDIIDDISTEEWYKVHSGMMRYNMSIITMLTEGLRRTKEDFKGYSPMHGVYNREPEQSKGESELDVLKLEYVENFVSLTRLKRIPLIVVASPKYGMKSSSSLQPVIDICKQNNVEFIDYYADTVFLNHKDWFVEPMHLNADGAKRFSTRIADRIADMVSAVQSK